MINDGYYIDIKIQNTSETVLDIGIHNCKNKEVLEVLKYYKEKKGSMMELRIISDLHLDINTGMPFDLKDKSIFTIICGDISGYFLKTSKWLNRNVENGVFVAGNHMIYNKSGHSLQYQLKQFQNNYPLDAPISFLNDNYKIIDDIVFVGGTLWTDYCLYGKERKYKYIWAALCYINDFRYGLFNPSDNLENEKASQIKMLKPENCAKMFFNTLSVIDEVCHKFPKKKIVVVTHHAPSEKSVPAIHKNSNITPAFASNLEEFILDHPNIKLWCHGHIHSACDYNIGGCRVICNPRGYAKYNEKAEVTGFNKDLIVKI